jgi:hypothetical protein
MPLSDWDVSDRLMPTCMANRIDSPSQNSISQVEPSVALDVKKSD